MILEVSKRYGFLEIRVLIIEYVTAENCIFVPYTMRNTFILSKSSVVGKKLKESNTFSLYASLLCGPKVKDLKL